MRFPRTQSVLASRRGPDHPHLDDARHALRLARRRAKSAWRAAALLAVAAAVALGFLGPAAVTVPVLGAALVASFGAGRARAAAAAAHRALRDARRAFRADIQANVEIAE